MKFEARSLSMKKKRTRREDRDRWRLITDNAENRTCERSCKRRKRDTAGTLDPPKSTVRTPALGGTVLCSRNIPVHLNRILKGS